MLVGWEMLLLRREEILPSLLFEIAIFISAPLSSSPSPPSLPPSNPHFISIKGLLTRGQNCLLLLTFFLKTSFFFFFFIPPRKKNLGKKEACWVEGGEWPFLNLCPLSPPPSLSRGRKRGELWWCQPWMTLIHKTCSDASFLLHLRTPAEKNYSVKTWGVFFLQFVDFQVGGRVS